jgi:hypothetical protein
MVILAWRIIEEVSVNAFFRYGTAVEKSYLPAFLEVLELDYYFWALVVSRRRKVTLDLQLWSSLKY